MLRSFAHALAVIAAIVPAAGQVDNVEVRIETRNNPLRMISVLRQSIATVPKGIELRPDPVTGTLVVKGTAEAVKDMREIVRLLDITPRRIDMRVRLIRMKKVEGRVQEEALADLRTAAYNNIPIVITGGDPDWDTEAAVLPRINGDGSISLRCGFQLLLDSQPLSQFEAINKRLPAGKTVSATFVRDKSDRAFSDAPKPGDLEQAKYAYRVEVSALMLDNPH